MIRKAEKAGLNAELISPDDEWIVEYYSLLRETFHRQGLAVPHPIAFYRQLIRLSKSGVALCVDVRVDQQMLAAGIFLLDERRMVYFSGVASKEGMRLAAPSLIQWRIMQEAVAAGVAEYDMGGLGVESIDKFKRSFGGQEIQHTRWICRSRLFGLIEPIARWMARRGLIRIGSG